MSPTSILIASNENENIFEILDNSLDFFHN